MKAKTLKSLPDFLPSQPPFLPRSQDLSFS